MNKLIVVISLVMTLLMPISGQNGTQLLSGTVIENESNKPLDGAIVSIEGLGSKITNSKGQFIFSGLKNGSYILRVTYIGYKSISDTIKYVGKKEVSISMIPNMEQIREVVVKGKKQDVDNSLNTLLTNEIKGVELTKIQGKALGEALQSIPGVSSLQTGPAIFKPVIHGLHSNRILIFNNGVRQEGQQWGLEHAPEIDTYAAQNLSVVKGAASIRYGADAIGGVILVQPAPMPVETGITGGVNLLASSNSRLGAVSANLQQAFNLKSGILSWRLQGTLKKAGNTRTPNYYLENTGFRESDFSSQVAYQNRNFGVETYYSQFNTDIGVFTGSHASSIADLQAAISRPEPITPSYFSYSIDRPHQTINHDLFKVSSYYNFKNDGRLEITYARQQNLRQEYDYIPLTGRLNPELYLKLITQTVDVVYKQNLGGGFESMLGINGMTQSNVRQYQMLIPNFRNYNGGVFYIDKWTHDKLTLEAGLRYDFSWMRAYMLNNNTLDIMTPLFVSKNLSGSIGAQYQFTPNLSWSINAGSAWRPPSINELLSNGVDLDAGMYMEGNKDLKKEVAYNVSSSLQYTNNRLKIELGLYNTIFDGYIFAKPSLTIIKDVRGSYFLYNYTQVNANFKGLDFSGSYDLTHALTYSAKMSLLYAWNKTIHDYLQQIPANRFESNLEWKFNGSKTFKQPYINFGAAYTAKQTRVPSNSDYAEPPAAYYLLNASAGASVKIFNQMININITGNNILNKAYRDYMDRFRYFSDEAGSNYSLRINIPLGKSNQ
jgi:iron complex outermembrane recepter protein